MHAVLQLRAKKNWVPSHPLQDMLDCLWKKNLRQFIYKVGWAGPGRPSPQSSSPSKSHSSLAVFQSIIHSAAPMGDEMAHHLYVLQALTLGLLEPRMRTPLDPYSQVQGAQRLEGHLGFCFQSMILTCPFPLTLGAAGAATGPAPGSL